MHTARSPGHLLHCMFTGRGSQVFFALFVQGAPHPPQLLMGDTWSKPYSREYAAFPAAWLRGAKFWPTTGTYEELNRRLHSREASSYHSITSSEARLNLCCLLACQVVWTTSTGTATSSARCSRRPRWPRKPRPQLQLRNLVREPR